MTFAPAFRRLSPRVYLHEAGSSPEPIPEGALAFAQVPSRAFGDGSHPTTRLCAGAWDLLCRQRRPSAALDVGTGTGILARIARARGARFVVGTDVDAEALTAARRNAAIDGHAIEIEFSSDAPDLWGARFDLAVANILEGPLRELAPALSRALAIGGTLLVSGFTALQSPALKLAFEAAGLTAITEARLDGWVLLGFQKRPAC